MKLTRWSADDPPPWANDPIEDFPMTEFPHQLIRAGRGRLRVLRVARSCGRCYPLRYTVTIGARGVCRGCGCTDRWGCATGCAWANSAHTICTRCLERMVVR